MSKLPTTPNNLKQPSPDNNGLGKHKQQSTDISKQAAEVNRDTDELAKQTPDESFKDESKVDKSKKPATR